MSEEASRIGSGGATSAGQQSERVPDFVPGWFKPREGAAAPAISSREAVRFVGSESFPINFLRPGESVRPARSGGLGVNIDRDGETLSLAVAPGFWIVRNADGKPYNWRDEDFKAKYRRTECDWIPPVERDEIDREAMARGAEALTAGIVSVEPKLASEIGKSASEVDAERRDQLRYVEGWKGTPPAQGTRRALILDTLEARGVLADRALDLADAIEEALVRVVDQGSTPESGSPASIAMDLLDRFDIPRTREGAILTIDARVTALADELVETRRDRDVKQSTIEGLAATVSAKADALERRVDGPTKLASRAEGKVPPGTHDLVIVLEDVSDPDGPPEYRFIELENQDGRSIGSFPIRSSEQPPLKEIVIPYSRDDAWVSEVAYQAAGAASGVFLREDPQKVMPSQEVADAVAELLKDFDIPRACRPCAEEEIKQGAKEVGDRRDATIKGLKAEVDRLLEGRESARLGEDRFKAQRDAALHLLRWLIGDLIPSHLVDLAGEEPS